MNDLEQMSLTQPEEELKQLEDALPAHGLKPTHLMRIEELEEELERRKGE